MEGRRLWEIGSWGNASDHIGRRWEEIGQQVLGVRLARDLSLRLTPQPPTLVALTEDEAVQAGLRSMGLTNPDAILFESGNGATSVRSVDFKWSIETATYRQISGTALNDLFSHPDSPLPALLDGDALGQVAPGSLAAIDGFFFAPDSQPNREFLDSPANRQQEYPIEPKDVVLEPVDGVHFFGVLPWWPQAIRLADLDRMPRGLESLEGAERYYRLGAGLGGAILKLHTSIFASEPPPLDVPAEAEELIGAFRLRSSLDVIEHLRRQMDERNQRVRRAKDLARCPYGYREMLADLGQRGVVVREGEGPEAKADRERWGQVHRAVVSAHRASLNAAGLKLVEQGMSEASALTALAQRRQDFEDQARALGHGLIRRELGG